MTRAGALAIALALLAGCAGPPAGGNGGAPDSTRDSTGTGMLRFERARGAPGDTVAGHARYTVAWPDPAQIPGSSAVAESLRAAIALFVSEGQLDPAGRPLPADSIGARFLAGHAQFVGEFPGGPREWFIDRTITLETLPFGLSTLRIDDARYEGGAHGMATTFWRSYDPRTGRVLKLHDVADEAGRDSLRRHGERAFRAAREIPAGTDLREAGFFLWEGGGEFELSENFGVTRAGLVFHYNPYDIAAYASGPTSITLPWDAVSRFVRADGPLSAVR